jgi:PD-(D/E)XK nuclease superfamily
MEPQNTQSTQMDTGEDKINLLSKRAIGCALTVMHALGTGFLGKIYETHWCMSYESGLAASQQHLIVVRYDGLWSGICF